MADVPEHTEETTIHFAVEYPDHVQRTQSLEFEQNKRMLVIKLDTPCFSCGSKDNREVHHFIVEWAEANNTDWNKVAKIAHHFDIYGFAGQLGDKPVNTPDDIRNLVVLCEKCHRGQGTGIHLVPFPNWISQVVAKDTVEILEAPKELTDKPKAV